MENLEKIDRALKNCDLFLLVSVVIWRKGRGREGGKGEGESERGKA